MKNKKTIGELIEYEVRKQQMPITDFARRICCRRNNVYDIFKRNKMDIMQLKLISEVLHRNFFKDLSEDVELINNVVKSKEEIKKRKIISQFFCVVPDVLQKLGKESTIIFHKPDGFEYKDYPIPDYGLPNYFITFTIGNTLKERVGKNEMLSIVTIPIGDRVVEVCINKINGWGCVNVKLDYMSFDEWYKVLTLAFDARERFLS